LHHSVKKILIAFAPNIVKQEGKKIQMF